MRKRLPLRASGLRGVRNEFLVRFYRWASADTLRQLREGFPRLRDLKSGPALRYLEFLDNLRGEQRLRFVVARLKQLHPVASRLCGELLSATEQALLDSFLEGHEVAMYGTPLRAYVSSRVEMALNDLKVSAPEGFHIDKALLLAEIATKAGFLVGQRDEKQEKPNSLLFEKKIGNWRVVTSFEATRTHQLKYHHSLRCAARKSYLIERTSAFGWMGVKMITYWNYLTPQDLEPTGNALSELCGLFMNAVPKLLRGLDLPS